MSKLLLLSNSTMPGTTFFSWPKPWVKSFLGTDCKAIAFIPYAALTISYDVYADNVSRAFESMEYAIQSVHAVPDKRALIKKADAIVVGGGNTFALLTKMHDEGLLAAVQERVREGAAYIGWSAGANLACPTIKTTNDMPVVMPPSFEGLSLIPFQINPHYHELKFENQGGETRKERLEEFLLVNPDQAVIGLPEGMLIKRQDSELYLLGDGTAKLYRSQEQALPLRGGDDISYLLE
jgi:dipeptidase E